jgi:uncharacterized protein (TIGR03085 family)
MRTRVGRAGGGRDDLRARERADFVATLRAVGPAAPTLCDAWLAGDIAAHVAVSEEAFGVPLFVFNGIRRVLPARLTRRLIDRAQSTGERLNARMSRRGWSEVLRYLEEGPPRLYGFGTLAQLRVVEEWIHHEDVRRGAGLPARTVDAAYEALLWQAGTCVAGFPEFQLGREGLELDAGNGRRFVVGVGPVCVRVSGPAGELLLYLAGRGAAADVSVVGDEETVRSLQPGLRV